MKHARRPASGFTLIELLTVLAVLSVVSTLGVTAYFQMTSYWNATVRGVDLQVRADNIIERMRADTGILVSARLTGHAIRGEERLEDEFRYNLVQLEDDRLILPVEYVHPLDGGLIRAKVMYHIERGGNAPVLKRTLGDFGVDVPAGASETVAEGVLSMRIHYHDGGRRVPGWDGEQHPDAIEVSLVLQDPNRPEEQVARRSVFPVRVR